MSNITTHSPDKCVFLEKLTSFREIWLFSLEIDRPNGENPVPISLTAREAHSGRTLDLGPDQFQGARKPLLPITLDQGVLFVTYDAPAVLGCFLSVGWPLPQHVIDLEAEFRCYVSGLNEDGDWSFERAQTFYSSEGAVGDPLENLLSRMLPILNLDHALLRGRYTAAVAIMERAGIPIDQIFYERLKASWPTVKASLIERVDQAYGVFEGTTFKMGLWEQWVTGREIPWPRDGAGGLELDDDTFTQMAVAYPKEVRPMWELRKTLNKLRVEKLAVGCDGRNRTPIRPFASKTGRNQPSTSRYIFGSAVWVRGMIKPGPGLAIAYVDYEQQEFGIAAALSGDEAMKTAYESGDPYLAFAKQCGAIPQAATKETHEEEREKYKSCAIGIQYGMGAHSLACSLNSTEDYARKLIQNHHEVYSRYWEWSDDTTSKARTDKMMRSVFGWKLNVSKDTKSGTIRNFPLQANGAEILRIACCRLVERGIVVCAPIHDAVLIEAHLDEIEEVTAVCQKIMTNAAKTVLNGFPLRTDIKIVRFPDLYMIRRGLQFWEEVNTIMNEKGT